MPTRRPRLLVIDDEQAILTLIGTVALDQGFDVSTTVDVADAMNQLRHRPADLVPLDLRMPGVSGLDVLRAVRDISPRCRVVLMSGFATIDSAVAAVKLGAMDFLSKPFDLARLRQLLADVREDAQRRAAVQTHDATWRSGWSSAAWSAAVRRPGRQRRRGDPAGLPAARATPGARPGGHSACDGRSRR